MTSDWACLDARLQTSTNALWLDILDDDCGLGKAIQFFTLVTAGSRHPLSGAEGSNTIWFPGKKGIGQDSLCNPPPSATACSYRDEYGVEERRLQ